MKSLIRVTAWERAAWWRRLLCAFGRVAALICVIVVLFAVLGPPIGAYLLVRKIAKGTPAVYITPQPLRDYSVSDAAGTELSYFGYSFEVPWKGISKKREAPNKSGPGGLVFVGFDSGQSVLLIVPGDQSGLFGEMVHDKDMQYLKPVFGDLAKGSPYDQYAALLNMSPSAIRIFGPSRERGGRMALLMVKAIALPKSLETGAFSFQLPGKRGFQIGDPSKSQRVQLEVLDLDGHYVEIICSASKNGANLRQSELNGILTTLRVVSPNAAGNVVSETLAR